MIENLAIENFKSIKNLKINCKRINIFIGEPNTGKSNILEAFGLLSFANRRQVSRLQDYVRFESLIDLFFDRNIEDLISIKLNECIFRLRFKSEEFRAEFAYPPNIVNPNWSSKDLNTVSLFNLNYEGNYQGGQSIFEEKIQNFVDEFKYYQFRKLRLFEDKTTEFLLPPTGQNLLHILLTRKELRTIISNVYKKYGLRLVFKPAEGKIEVQKEQDDIVISIPYSLSSETLQRITFYLAAIYSNKNSIITFEEPEAHAFPYYMKYLAERVAMDVNKNQYFIVTHNPYFLMSVIEKTPKEELAAYGTYYEDYQTKIKLLSSSDLEDAFSMGSDFFLNLDRFIEGKQ